MFKNYNKIGIMKKEQVFGLARHAFTIIGGALVTKGLVDDAVATELVGIGMSIVGIIWSMKSK